jgi:hypothetical protein
MIRGANSYGKEKGRACFCAAWNGVWRSMSLLMSSTCPRDAVKCRELPGYDRLLAKAVEHGRDRQGML